MKNKKTRGAAGAGFDRIDSIASIDPAGPRSRRSPRPIHGGVAALLLTLLTHAVFFYSLGFFLARETPLPPHVEKPFSISIEWAEVDEAPPVETPPEMSVPEPEPPPEPVHEPEPEPEPEPIPEPEPEPVLTQPEPAPTLPEPEPEPEPPPAEPEPEPAPAPPPEIPREPRPPAGENPPPKTTQPVVNQEPSAGASQPAAVEPAPGPVVLPRARNAIRPSYPLDARRRGEAGTVTHDIAISEKGAVTGATLVESSGYPELDRAARRAILSARFAPATRDGRAVPHILRLPVEFKLVDR